MKEEVPDTVNGGSKNTSAGDDDLELFDGMSLPSIEVVQYSTTTGCLCYGRKQKYVM